MIKNRNVEIFEFDRAPYENVSLYKSTIENLPTTNSYSVITLLLVLHFLSDDGEKENILQEIYYKLTTDSTFILFDICGTREDRLKALAAKVGFAKIVKFHQSTITRAWILTKN